MQVGATDDVEAPTLSFTDGIPGFAAARRFVLADLTEDGMFQELTSVDDPDLSMVVASPWYFFPEYAPEISDDDQRSLGLADAAEAALFCAVVVDEDRLVMNLRAPFVANARTRAARQVVLNDADLPLRAPVIAQDEGR